MHQESLIPVGPAKYQGSPERIDPVDYEQPGPSTSQINLFEDNLDHIDDTTEKTEKIPMLIRGIGVHQVIPKEATRDVLAGRVAFYLVDDKDGVTLFPPKHIFAALKLDKDHVIKFEDYSCLGAHQRLFEMKPRKREGMGYRRKYISPELIHRGIYIKYHLGVGRNIFWKNY